MNWLTPEESQKLFSECKAEPQALVFYCETTELGAYLPVKPRYVSTEEGPVSPVNEWLGFIHNRPVVVQQEQKPIGPDPYSVTVLTPYAEGAMGDWATLELLDELPRPIQTSLPLYIQSHTTSRNHVVYRPSSQGWDYSLYHATSRADAEKLLSYLNQRDPRNKECFIGSYETRGYWNIVTRRADRESLVGTYEDMNSALRVACDFSTKQPDTLLIVKDVSEKPQPNIFEVARGKVQRSPRWL